MSEMAKTGQIASPVVCVVCGHTEDPTTAADEVLLQSLAAHIVEAVLPPYEAEVRRLREENSALMLDADEYTRMTEGQHAALRIIASRPPNGEGAIRIAEQTLRELRDA